MYGFHEFSPSKRVSVSNFPKVCSNFILFIFFVFNSQCGDDYEVDKSEAVFVGIIPNPARIRGILEQ